MPTTPRLPHSHSQTNSFSDAATTTTMTLLSRRSLYLSAIATCLIWELAGFIAYLRVDLCLQAGSNLWRLACG
ncbi:MAG: hypothetical protein HC838_11520 [Spirulinaceae cyanobacterium RM2_2_10]|nr:hypothetical protein [Spirulinaceae cyanobacterium SM2_1_0]NJO20534.1 hypothetical protein [Spirulinaceae cyanobacterium RM2_2_10]